MIDILIAGLMATHRHASRSVESMEKTLESINGDTVKECKSTIKDFSIMLEGYRMVEKASKHLLNEHNVIVMPNQTYYSKLEQKVIPYETLGETLNKNHYFDVNSNE